MKLTKLEKSILALLVLCILSVVFLPGCTGSDSVREEILRKQFRADRERSAIESFCSRLHSDLESAMTESRKPCIHKMQIQREEDEKRRKHLEAKMHPKDAERFRIIHSSPIPVGCYQIAPSNIMEYCKDAFKILIRE